LGVSYEGKTNTTTRQHEKERYFPNVLCCQHNM
jgi:hypothetical protein